jgi:hypothetical protein
MFLKSGNPTELGLAPAPATQAATPIQTDVFSRWGEQMSRELLTLEGRNLQAAEQFSGRASVARFHRCVVADIRATAHRVMRTRSLIAADEDRYFKVMWQVSGRNRIEHKGSALTVEPGEWTIYDTAQPYSIDTSEGSHFLVLLLPVSQVGPAASGIEFVAGKVDTG